LVRESVDRCAESRTDSGGFVVDEPDAEPVEALGIAD
jgi:hypothetical protein